MTQSMQTLLEQEVERQRNEITALCITMARMDRRRVHLLDQLDIAEKQRDQARADARGRAVSDVPMPGVM
jgi:hypothetical protein